MSNRIMTLLGFLFAITLLAAIVWFVVIVFTDRYHRSHPPIDLVPFPKSQEEMKTPPDLFPVQPHDVKG